MPYLKFRSTSDAHPAHKEEDDQEWPKERRSHSSVWYNPLPHTTSPLTRYSKHQAYNLIVTLIVISHLVHRTKYSLHNPLIDCVRYSAWHLQASSLQTLYNNGKRHRHVCIWQIEYRHTHPCLTSLDSPPRTCLLFLGLSSTAPSDSVEQPSWTSLSNARSSISRPPQLCQKAGNSDSVHHQRLE